MTTRSSLADRLRQWLLAVLALSLLSGCATQTPWPAVTTEPTGVTTPGHWIWSELFTADVEAAKAFYGEVFGWRFETYGQRGRQYTLVSNGETPVAGMLHHADSADAARRASWVAVLSVADVDAAVQRAEANQGAVLVTARELAGRGRVAVLADPELARFAVLTPTGGNPPDVFPPNGSWLWRELWAQSGRDMAAFYRDIGSYVVEPKGELAGLREWHLVTDGFPRAGIIEVERDDLPSTWLQYVRVADLEGTLEKVRRAGGRVLVSPSPDVRAGRVAVFVDPLGAAIGIAEWPEPEPAGGAS